MANISRSEIPNKPFYVLCNDSFMSGWGQAEGKTNTIILPCDSYEIAEIVAQNAADRSDQKRIRIVGGKPKLQNHVHYSLAGIPGREYRTWYETGRPFRSKGGR